VALFDWNIVSFPAFPQVVPRRFKVRRFRYCLADDEDCLRGDIREVLDLSRLMMRGNVGLAQKP
jgi:hypothetical protein